MVCLMDCLIVMCMLYLWRVDLEVVVFVDCYIGFMDVVQCMMFDVFGIDVVGVDDVLIVVEVLMCQVVFVLIYIGFLLDDFVFWIFGVVSEIEVLVELCGFVLCNIVNCLMIGIGYYGIIILQVIQWNVLENLFWYMVYMLYQLEILQGCLEVFINFQIMVVDFIGFIMVNVFMFDELIVVVEGMLLVRCVLKFFLNVFVVDVDVFLQIVVMFVMCVLVFGIEIVLVDFVVGEELFESLFGVFVQYLGVFGWVWDFLVVFDVVYFVGGFVVVVVDFFVFMLIVLLGLFGVDVVVGMIQCFGVFMGFGGLYVGYMVVCFGFECQFFGCLVGVLVDVDGKFVYWFLLQICEQYICCEKVILNICIVQVFLVVMVLMYVVYYGFDGLCQIVLGVVMKVVLLCDWLIEVGVEVVYEFFFDMLLVCVLGWVVGYVVQVCDGYGILFWVMDVDMIGILVDEIIMVIEFYQVVMVFGGVQECVFGFVGGENVLLLEFC